MAYFGDSFLSLMLLLPFRCMRKGSEVSIRLVYQSKDNGKIINQSLFFGTYTV